MVLMLGANWQTWWRRRPGLRPPLCPRPLPSPLHGIFVQGIRGSGLSTCRPEGMARVHQFLLYLFGSKFTKEGPWGWDRHPPPLGAVGREDLPGIHDVVGVEGLLEAFLQGDGRFGKFHADIRGLGQTDAVLPG